MPMKRPGMRAGRLAAGAAIAAITLGGGIASGGDAPGDDLGAVETAFAATMAERDLDAFATFLDPEVVFFNGPIELRGVEAVVDAWARFFEAEAAPFSWRPEVVSTLDSGKLGLTSGPVFDPEGNRIGTFNSIWRRNAEGVWKIVFDRGCE
jgi:ketosteroid isomerase-like protein